MKKSLIMAGLVLLSGCATYNPSPQVIGGYYHFVGDKDCVTHQQVSPTRIVCSDRKERLTGYRDAMTDQQLTQWRAAVLQRIQADSLASQELAQGLQRSQAFLNSSTQLLQQRQQLTVPQVQPINPWPTNPSVIYSPVANGYVGSDGSWARQIGSTWIGSDGSTCQMVGSQAVCRK